MWVCAVVCLREDVRAGGGFKENSDSRSSILDDRTFSSSMSIRPVKHLSSTYTAWLDHWGHPHSYTCQTVTERQTDRQRQSDNETARKEICCLFLLFCFTYVWEHKPSGSQKNSLKCAVACFGLKDFWCKIHIWASFNLNMILFWTIT